MARQRSTPPRGSTPLSWPSSLHPSDGLSERGRPTVQEVPAPTPGTSKVVASLAPAAARAEAAHKDAMNALRSQPLSQAVYTATPGATALKTELDTLPIEGRPPLALSTHAARPRDPALFLGKSGPLDGTSVQVRAFPLVKSKDTDPRLCMQREPDSARAAAFRVLRYRVEHLHIDPLRTLVIAVCAPRPGQGTTTCAANLALALSECDRARVCLVEANLRRPSLTNLFHINPPMCFAERLALERQQSAEPWSVGELSRSLHVLCVRDGTPDQPLIDGRAFSAAVEVLRRAGYHHVVIDGPEVLSIADMNLVEEVVDGVLLIGQGGVTTASDLRAAAGQLSTRKLCGIVLLDAE